MMDGRRWERIQALFHLAAKLPEDQRRAFLDGASSGDPGIVTDVLRLLEEDARELPLIDRGLAPVAGRMLDTVAGATAPPRTLGPYQIREVLGEGGMGVVYLAEHPGLGRRVAIKILRDAWLSPARRERFAAEQRTLAQLNHPLIARLYETDTLADGTPWFAMEYVDGVPLTDYCRRHATSIPGRLQLFRSVCETVLFAHRHAVIHRDLKPSNILVKADGSIRLLDFGIAKQLEALDAPVDQTRTALRFMTPAYAAPEQMRGERVGIHADVYSLGVVLYQLLTGRLPYNLENLTPAQAAERVAAGDVAKPSTAARELAAALPAGRRAAPSSRAAWADLDILCLTAMHPDLRRRYRSVEALLRDIDHFLALEPLEARPDSFRYRVAKFTGRNKRAVAAVAIGIATVIGLVTFFTARLAGARNAAVAEAARTQRIQRFMMSLFEGGDAEAGPADSLRVVTLVEQGLRGAHALDADPEVQAELFHTLGTIYEKLGKLEQAESLLELSLERRRSLFGEKHPAVGETLTDFGLLRIAQARLDDAEPMIRQGLAVSRQSLPGHHPQVAKAVGALGRLLVQRGEYDQAIGVLEEALRLLSAPNTPPQDLVAGITELANANFYAGRYDDSRSLNERALEMDRLLWGDRHPHVADDLINLAAIRFNLGHYAEAEALDRDALEIIRDWYGPDHPETASAMTILGRALVFLDRRDEAEGLLRQSLAIQERVYGAVHPRVASALNELSGIALHRGDYDEAEGLSLRQIEIYRSVYGERHYLVALGLANLASIYLQREQWTRAEPILSDVVQRFTNALSPDDLNTGIARIKLGRSLVGQQRYADAERETLAGYEIVARQSEPSVSWLVSARRILVKAYEGLGRAEDAARFRAELPKEGAK